MRISYSGHFLDPSGYGAAARRMVSALELAGADVRIGVNLSDQSRPIRPDAHIAAFFARGPHETQADVHIVHTLGHKFPEVIPRVSAYYAVGMTCWETSHLPAPMIQGCSAVQLVLVPCVDNVQVFRAAGLKTALVPYPVGPNIYAEPIPALAAVKSTHTLYTVAAWQPRKNLQGTLVAMLTATADRDDVSIILKVSGGPMVQSSVETAVLQLRAALKLPGRPDIHVIGRITEEQMYWLHQMASCYVSLSHGEGFGIPALDALAAGRTLILSNHGGYRDLLHPHGRIRCGAYGVSCRLTPVVQDYPLFDGTQLWGDPDLYEAQRTIRDVLVGRRQTCVRDLSMYAPAYVGKQLLRTLEEAA